MKRVEHVGRPIRILLFTMDDYFYLPNYLFDLIDKYGDRIVGYYECKQKSPFLSTRDLIRLCGVPRFMKHGAIYAFRKMMTMLGSRKFSIINRLKQRRVYRIQSEKVSSDEFYSEVSDLDPDVILSVGNNVIIPKKILQIPSAGAYNAHCSVLPKFRGVLTAFWTLLTESDEIGVTIHQIGEGIDDGPIAYQYREKRGSLTTMHSIYSKMTEEGGRLLLELVDDLERTGIELKDNDDSQKTEFGRPKPEDIENFIKKGYRFC